jgi:hypothetical protein
MAIPELTLFSGCKSVQANNKSKGPRAITALMLDVITDGRFTGDRFITKYAFSVGLVIYLTRSWQTITLAIWSSLVFSAAVYVLR